VSHQKFRWKRRRTDYVFEISFKHWLVVAMFKNLSYFTYGQINRSHFQTRLRRSIVSQLPELKLRKWQEEALIACKSAIKDLKWGVVVAATGSGKSALISSLCASTEGRILITVPTQHLVHQLSKDLQSKICPSEIGLYYQSKKDISKRITICTLQSLPLIVQENLFERPSLWIADECHRTETEIIKQSVIKMFPKTAIGFTATAFRASKKEELSLWTDVIYIYTIQNATKDGILVPFEIIPWNKQAGELDECELDDAAIEMIKERQLDPLVGPGMVNATSIEHAKAFSDRLCKEGIPSAAIHSKLYSFEKEERLESLKLGKYKALVHVSMLAEGIAFLLLGLFLIDIDISF
jgi:superfamily II DNA or RNA helicase